MRRYRIGASLEVRFEKTTLEFIKWAHDIGLDHVEVKRDHDFIYPVNINEIRKVLRDYDMTLGYHAPYRDFNLSSINPHTRINCVRQVKEIIELTHSIGGDYVNIHLGYIPDYYPEVAKAKARENCIKSVREIAKFANDLGVKLCIENDPHKSNMLQFGERVDSLFEIISEVDEYIGITLDVGHANTSKSPISEFIETFKDMLLVVHLHDNDGTADSHLPLGRGNINFKEILTALDNVCNNDLVLLFEMKRCKDIYESKKIMRGLLFHKL